MAGSSIRRLERERRPTLTYPEGWLWHSFEHWKDAGTAWSLPDRDGREEVEWCAGRLPLPADE